MNERIFKDSLKNRDGSETYNAKVIEYDTELHITSYMKSIERGKVQDAQTNFRKSYKNVERTEKEEMHCINQSLNRTKNNIYYLARSNTWEYFFTLTFNQQVWDSADYELVVKLLGKFLNNFKNRKNKDLLYLFVPELHKDGEHYHFHGLVSNCEQMNFVDSGHVTSTGEVIYNVSDWKYGFSTATIVQDTDRVSGYITKYVTKDMCRVLKNKRRYYVSGNAERAETKLCVLDPDELFNEYGDRINYLNSQDVPAAYQRCTYIEVSKQCQNILWNQNVTS